MSNSVRPHAANPPSPVDDRRPILHAMLNPKSIALIGATEATTSVGRTVMENLRSSGGSRFPVNLPGVPKAELLLS